MSMSNQKRLQEAYEWAESFGGKCLSKKWERWDGPLEFACPNGHLFTKTHAKIRGRQGNTFCRLCKEEAAQRKAELLKNPPITIELVLR